MRTWNQILRVGGTGYFLALMLLSACILIFSDSKKFKRRELKRESRFAYVSGIVYGVVGIILYAMRNL